MHLSRSIIAGIAAAVLCGAAAAQSPVLSAAEARSELFGVRLSGVIEGSGEPWEECIEPAGRTVYRFAGRSIEGRLSIDPDGSACFTYADDGYTQRSCFVVRRAGANYRFDEFVTRRVERGVTRCAGGSGLVASAYGGSRRPS
jgi:hypothetical protein